MIFRFASPYFLAFFAILPIIFFFRKKFLSHPVLGVSKGLFYKKAVFSPLLAVNAALPALKYLTLILIIIALARPQYGRREVTVETEGINMILALDISESMAALDFEKNGKNINRLEAVKDVVERFIQNRDGDRIGMVVFGAEAYTQIPLTRDYQAILSMMEKVKIGAAGKSTSIGDAIGISLKRIKDVEAKSNIIILLTDGKSNSGEIEPMNAAEIAKDLGIKIYTVGVGSKGKAPFIIKHPMFGNRVVYRYVDFDEDTLKAISDETGGLYFKAENLKTLENVYATIDRLEKTTAKMKTHAQYNDLYLWFLIPALCISILWVILTNTRFLRIP